MLQKPKYVNLPLSDIELTLVPYVCLHDIEEHGVSHTALV